MLGVRSHSPFRMWEQSATLARSESREGVVMDIIEQAVPDGDAPQPPEERRLNLRIALAVAVLATFMGITKVKDDNIVQAMLQAKSDAVDTWSEFQAKSTKQHLSEVAADELTVLRVMNQGQAPAAR